MKKTVGVAALATTILALPAISLGEESGLTLTPSIGYFDYENDRSFEIKDDAFGSLGLGYRFDNPWQLELVYKYGESEIKGTDTDVDYHGWHLDGLYHLTSGDRLTPYLAIGAGYVEAEADMAGVGSTAYESNLNAGAGIKYALNDWSSLRTDLRAFRDFDDDNVDLAVSLGLQFLLGGGSSKPAPVAVAPAAGDADADGVSDNVDRCAATSRGVQVDANGCALDDDNDGVPNHRDDCPNSEAGARVDTKGCYAMLKESREIELKVNFSNNSDVVNEQYVDQIKAVADFLTEYPVTKVVVEGHTDSNGKANYNQQLSERRAAAVAKTLVERFNVAADRVSSVGYGESKPVADNETKEGRAANRRVVAVVSATVEKRAE